MTKLIKIKLYEQQNQLSNERKGDNEALLDELRFVTARCGDGVRLLVFIVGTFLSAVDKMSCSAKNYVSLSGSNGCADPLGLHGRFACKELTNWDGSKKQGLAAPEKKKGGGRGY